MVVVADVETVAAVKAQMRAGCEVSAQELRLLQWWTQLRSRQ